jgi:2-oxoacid:acceptor oxidoreductase delta subunit (pyruvate/2-ketoisovalerate family)
MNHRYPRWQDLPLGGVITEAGNAAAYKTGGWRAFRPLINWVKTETMKACTGCLICWLYCPDSAMLIQDGTFAGVDLDHCKGCGICAAVCPVKCITLLEEADAR